jgi:HEPN domain-containing protein
MRRTPLEEGLRWLEQAEEDLKWAGLLAEQGGYHLACFHAQQVAEMALKAFLYAQGEEIVLGHSVERLSTSAAAHDPAFGELGKRWSVLDSYYVAARYPNSLPDSIPAKVFNAEAAGRAVELAGEAVEFVRQHLTKAN